VAQNSKKFCQGYLDSDGSNVAWDMIRACWASVAFLSLAPMQDFLDLGNEARMNYPGNPSGNWKWRMQDGAFDSHLRKKIKEINFLYSRTGSKNGG
jgi:4-alpha-glucanotransferase